MDTAAITGTFCPKRSVARTFEYECLGMPCVGGVKRHLAFDDEGDADIHHKCGPECRSQDLWEDLDSSPDVSIEWEYRVPRVPHYNVCEGTFSIDSIADESPVQSGFGFVGSSSTLTKNRPLRKWDTVLFQPDSSSRNTLPRGNNTVTLSVPESDIYPPDWSQDSVFLPSPPCWNSCNATVTLAQEEEKSRTFGMTFVEDDGSESYGISWDYSSIRSPDQASTQDRPLCSTPKPPIQVGSLLSSWNIWKPLACLAVAGASSRFSFLSDFCMSLLALAKQRKV